MNDYFVSIHDVANTGEARDDVSRLIDSMLERHSYSVDRLQGLFEYVLSLYLYGRGITLLATNDVEANGTANELRRFMCPQRDSVGYAA